jgi:hypothetical protein
MIKRIGFPKRRREAAVGERVPLAMVPATLATSSGLRPGDVIKPVTERRRFRQHSFDTRSCRGAQGMRRDGKVAIALLSCGVMCKCRSRQTRFSVLRGRVAWSRTYGRLVVNAWRA